MQYGIARANSPDRINMNYANTTGQRNDLFNIHFYFIYIFGRIKFYIVITGNRRVRMSQRLAVSNVLIFLLIKVFKVIYNYLIKNSMKDNRKTLQHKI